MFSPTTSQKTIYAYEMSSFTKLSVTQPNYDDTGTGDFCYSLENLLLNLFSVPLLWLRTGRLCPEKFLVDTKIKRISLLYFLGSESFVLYYETSLTHFN